MTDTHIAKLMWGAYATQAGGKTFDGKPLPSWEELGEERQSCWVAAAFVAADRIEKLEAELHHCFHRIEELQAALRELSTGWDCCAVSKTMKLIARKALEGKDE